MQQFIMHVDMDAFFASVEQMDNPDLRGKPVAVGGESSRSVISAASYEIRKYGVHSAMPVGQALKLCPHAIIIPGRRDRYKELSNIIMQILSDYSPVVEQASIDEAYLDITGTEKLFGPPQKLGATIKKRIKKETGLTASVGIAPIKFLAKIASDLQKPDGLSFIHPDEVEGFMAKLPIEKIPGVGKKSVPLFHSLAVYKAADLLRYSREFWKNRIGERGPVLYNKALGIDPSRVTPESAIKSSSAENTFGEDISSIAELKKWLLIQSERVAGELRKNEVKGRTVTVKIKYPDFRQITRSRSLETPTSHAMTIYETGCAILDVLGDTGPVRLIGIGVSNFGKKQVHLSLFEEKDEGRLDKLDQAVDRVREKFGKSMLTRAGLLDRGK
jgi:DNA polymerase-4